MGSSAEGTSRLTASELAETPDTPPEPGPTSGATPSLTKRLVSGGLWALLGRAVFMVGGLAVTTLLTRALDPTDFGSYVLVMTLATVASTFGLLGMGKAVVRFVPASLAIGDPQSAAGAIRTAFRTAGISVGAVALLLIALASRVLSPLLDLEISGLTTGLLVVWAAMLTAQSLLAETYRSFHDIRLAALFNGGVRSALLVALLVALRLSGIDLGLQEAIILTVVAMVCSNLLALVFLRQHIGGLGAAVPVPVRKVVAVGWPLMVNQILVFVIMRANLWIVNANLDRTDVAVYGAVLQLITLLTTPLLLMNAVLPPLISEMYAQPSKHRTLERTLRTVATVAGLPALGVLVLFAVGGETILGIVFGDFYRQGATALALLGLSQIANVWTGMCGPLLSMTQHQKALMWFNLLFSLVAVTVALILVPRFGINGAALATTAAILLQNASVSVYAYRKTGIISVGEIRPGRLVRDGKRMLAGRAQ